jgi:hypothetical protein
MDVVGNIEACYKRITWQRLTLQYVLNYTFYCRLLPLCFAAVNDCVHEQGIGLKHPTALGYFGVFILKTFEDLSGEYRTYFSLGTAGYFRGNKTAKA